MTRRLLQYIVFFISVNVIVAQNPCEPNPCERDGICFPRSDDFFCLCPVNVAGKTCEISDPCDPNPCESGGICFPQTDDFFCLCPVDVEGKTCEITATTESIQSTTVSPTFLPTTFLGSEIVTKRISQSTDVTTGTLKSNMTESGTEPSSYSSPLGTELMTAEFTPNLTTVCDEATESFVNSDTFELVYLEGSLADGTLVRWYYDDTNERVLHFKLETKALEDDAWSCDAVIFKTNRMIRLNNLQARGVKFVRIAVVTKV